MSSKNCTHERGSRSFLTRLRMHGSLFFSRSRMPCCVSGDSLEPSAPGAAAPTAPPPVLLLLQPWPRLATSLSTSATRSRGTSPPTTPARRGLRPSPWKWLSSRSHPLECDANTTSWSLTPHLLGARQTMHLKWFPSSQERTSHLWELLSEFVHCEPEESFTWYFCYGRQFRNGVSLYNICELLWIPSFIQDWATNVTEMQAKYTSKTWSNWPSFRYRVLLVNLEPFIPLKKLKPLSIFFFLTLNFELDYFSIWLWIWFLIFFLISINSDVTQMFLPSTQCKPHKLHDLCKTKWISNTEVTECVEKSCIWQEDVMIWMKKKLSQFAQNIRWASLFMDLLRS